MSMNEKIGYLFILSSLLFGIIACKAVAPRPMVSEAPSAVPTVTLTATWVATSTATLAATPTSTPTVTPTPSSTPTLTPTSLLLVQVGTLLPPSFIPITETNSAQVSGLAEWREDTVTDLAWTPDGRILAVADSAQIKLYDVPKRQVLRSLHPRNEGIIDLAFSPSGTWLVSGSRWGSDQTGYISNLELWSGPDWKPMGVLYGVGRALSSLDFSPDGRAFAAAFTSPVYEENSVEFWNTTTWEITETVKTGTVLNIAFSSVGGLIAASPDRYAIQIWDMRKDRKLFKLFTSFTGAVTKMAFSPNGLTLASGHYDGDINLWDMRTGNLQLLFHTDEVIESLAFSPDGHILATGGSYQNNLVRLWDVSTGTLLRTLEGHTNAVGYLLFDPTGQFLVSASYDGTIRLWGIRP
jgi:WD40 repeat protein